MALARAAEDGLGSAVRSEAGRDKGGGPGGGGGVRPALTLRAGAVALKVLEILLAWWGGPGGRGGGEANLLMPGRHEECLLSFRNYPQSAPVLWRRNFW